MYFSFSAPTPEVEDALDLSFRGKQQSSMVSRGMGSLIPFTALIVPHLSHF